MLELYLLGIIATYATLLLLNYDFNLPKGVVIVISLGSWGIFGIFFVLVLLQTIAILLFNFTLFGDEYED